MKNMVLFLGVLLLLGGFVVLSQHVKNNDLRDQILDKDRCISTMKENFKTAIKLESVDTWYVVNPNKVSSLPDGQGEIVNLSDRSLLPMGSRLGIKRPVPNTKIRFSPSESIGQTYTVAGGWLAYEYLDD